MILKWVKRRKDTNTAKRLIVESMALATLAGNQFSKTGFPMLIDSNAGYYKQVFDALNERFFDGDLPYPACFVSKPGLTGQSPLNYKEDFPAAGLHIALKNYNAIAIDPTLDEITFAQVMLHEMIHFKLWLETGEQHHHVSALWRAECRRIASLMLDVREPTGYDDFNYFPLWLDRRHPLD